MANIHGLGDYNTGSSNNQRQGMWGGQGQQPQQLSPEDQEAANMFGGMSGQQSKHPRDENFWDMWKTTFCPTFTAKRFIFFVILANMGVYIITLLFTWFEGLNLNEFIFLGPSPKVLQQFGACDPYQIRYHFEIWRLITPLFLSYGLYSFVITSCVLAIVGFMLEGSIGFKRMAFMYLICGFGGYLMSAVSESKHSIGCGVATFGLIAGLAALLIVNWKALDNLSQMRCMMIVMIIMFLLLTLFLLIGQQDFSIFTQLNPLGHTGGFLTGLFVGLCLMPAVRQEASYHHSFEKKVRKVGYGLTFLYFTILIILFYTVSEPTYLKYYG